jgi:hypothetical protein
VCSGGDAKRKFFRGLLPTSRVSSTDHNINIVKDIQWGNIMKDFNRQIVAAETDPDSLTVLFKLNLLDPIEVQKSDANCKDLEAFKRCAQQIAESVMHSAGMATTNAGRVANGQAEVFAAGQTVSANTAGLAHLQSHQPLESNFTHSATYTSGQFGLPGAPHLGDAKQNVLRTRAAH